MDASEIDLIVLATTTAGRHVSRHGDKVQAALGITQGAAFDVQAVCAGFIYALATADNFVRAGQAKRALVIGAETFHAHPRLGDRTTCVLFGDEAGAVVLEAEEVQAGTNRSSYGVLSTHLHSDAPRAGCPLCGRGGLRRLEPRAMCG